MHQGLKNLSDNLAKIPGEIKSSQSKIIPSSVARSDKVSDHGNKKILFTFIKYKQTHCQIYLLGKREAKRLTEELRKINQAETKNIFNQQASGIACKPVHKSGRYQPLFEKIPEDAQLLEVDYTGKGRIFGYLVENIFNIVLINTRHL